MDLNDFIANINNDLHSTLIEREQRSTFIRALLEVEDRVEPDEVVVTPEENKVILDELYNVYALQQTLQDKIPLIDLVGEVSTRSFHKEYLKSYRSMHRVIDKLKSHIFEFEKARGNNYVFDVTLKKLRYVMITMIQVYLTEFPTYAPIIHRYGSILRTIFIDIWRNLILDNDNIILREARKNNRNIIRRPSDSEPAQVSAVYISNENRIVKSIVRYPEKSYMIDVQDMTCDCPDFMYRRRFTGECCKHLHRFRNESGCLVLLNRVVEKHLYNVPCPLRDMLHRAYDERVDFLPEH